METRSVKISKHYFTKPVLWATLSFIITLLLLIFSKETDKSNIFSSINTAGLSFSLTFVAFSVTALALLNLLQEKEWYQEVANSKFFQSFINRFLISIHVSLVILLLSIMLIIIDSSNLLPFSIWLAPFITGLLVFTIFWVWRCVIDFVSLFRNEDKKLQS